MDLKTLLISLVRAALNNGDLGLQGPTPDSSLWQQADWPAVHALAVSQSLEGVTWAGVEAAGLCDAVPSAERATWSTQANNVLRRRVLFDAEAECVFGAMHRAGIATLPLKGASIASCYPDPRMRAMADIDVLYGFVERAPGSSDYRVVETSTQPREETVKHATKTLVNVMTGLGYQVESCGAGMHDVFHKEPLYNFETHRKLFSAALPFAAAFENPWERAIPCDDAPLSDQGVPLAFRYIVEDEYAYLMCHAYKHYVSSGCGIRFLVDAEAMRRAHGAQLDWQLVDMRMRQLGIEQWEARMRALSRAAFAPEGSCALSSEQSAELEHMLGLGTYGTLKNRVKQSLEGPREQQGTRGSARGARGVCGVCGYIKQRLFLDETKLRELFPFYYEHKWARPALPLVRLARGCRKGNVQRELKTLWSLVVRDAR